MAEVFHWDRMLPRVFLLTLLIALVLGPPSPVHAWELVDSGLKLAQPPISASPVIASMQADLDGTGEPETLVVKNGLAEIRTRDLTRWKSPPAWQVRQGIIADLNRDGKLEAVLLVWRPFKPWPVDAWLPDNGRINSFQDSSGMSCHIILIGWYRGDFRERWAGSPLAEPVNRLAAVDLEGSGRQFLVTLESDYDDPRFAPARRLKVWQWNGFGFTVVSAMEGSFHWMSILRAKNGKMFILAP